MKKKNTQNKNGKNKKFWNDKWVSQQIQQLETKLWTKYNYRDCIMADTQAKHNFYITETYTYKIENKHTYEICTWKSPN